MTKKISLILLTLALLFTSCGTRSSNNTQTTTLSPTHDYGVLINGIRWATRNVDAPGTFAQNPEDSGMLFQWGCKKAWNTIDSSVEGWDNFTMGWRGLIGDWETEKDPCPTGWRVPTYEELVSLLYVESEATVRNGINGRLFGVAPNQIFLPTVGFRAGHSRSGTLVNQNIFGYYWSSPLHREINARSLQFSYSRLWGVLLSAPTNGYSVRCVSTN